MVEKKRLPERKMIKLYLAGVGSSELAEKYGCDAGTILDRLRSKKIKIRRHGGLRRSALKKPKHNDVVYLAGIIDGEGSIPFLRNPSSHDGKTVEIGIANTSIELLEWLTKTFGYNYSEKRRLGVPSTHKRQWQWRVRRVKDVYRILKMTYPFLIIKRKKAKEVMEYLEKLYGFSEVAYGQRYETPKAYKRRAKNGGFEI